MKVLLLSLGVGALNEREIPDKKEYIEQQLLGEGTFPYRTAKYRFHGEEKIYESPFVAEPLIDRFQPDIVVLIGTVRSCWSSFFAKYSDDTEHEKKSNLALSLFESEETHGLNTPQSEINEIEKKIKDTLDELSIYSNNKPVKLIPVLIPYGLADGDTRETYSKISRVLKDVFDQADSVEVAFDITHSFRSMPIYNLTVVNYFSSLQDKPIDITHVYYGNLDVRSENNDVAEIIDLKDMVDILKLTGGVSEFKNTGSTLTLSNHMQDERLKELLEEFDFSTQMNAFDDIDASIEAILDYMDETGAQGARNADLADMLKAALGKALVDMDVLETDYWRSLPFWAKQYAIGQWFLRQKRYGLAVAVGMEAVRSSLASVYLNTNRERLTNEEIISNENYRKDTIERLKRGKYRIRECEISDGLATMAHWCKECKPIRDKFAHNLSEPAEETRRKIESLFESLTWLKIKLEDDRENFSRIYNTELFLSDHHGSNQKEEKKKRVIIIDKKNIEGELQKFTEDKKNEYDVYYPDAEVRELLKKDQGPLKDCEPLQSAGMLYQMLKRNNFLNDGVTDIIFYGLSWKQQYYYYPLLRVVIGNPMMHYTDGQLLFIGKTDYLRDAAVEQMGKPLTGKYGEYTERSFLRYTKKSKKKKAKEKTEKNSPVENRPATDDDLKKLAEAVNKNRL